MHALKRCFRCNTNVKNSWIRTSLKIPSGPGAFFVRNLRIALVISSSLISGGNRSRSGYVVSVNFFLFFISGWEKKNLFFRAFTLASGIAAVSCVIYKSGICDNSGGSMLFVRAYFASFQNPNCVTVISFTFVLNSSFLAFLIAFSFALTAF